MASDSRAHERANARDAPSPWRFLGSRTRVRVRVRTRVRWSFVGAHSTCDAQRGMPCWNLRPEARGLRTRSSPRLALRSWQDGRTDGRSPRGVTQSAICPICHLPFARGPVRLWACFCRPLAERRAPCTVHRARTYLARSELASVNVGRPPPCVRGKWTGARVRGCQGADSSDPGSSGV